jgi:hydrogenase expression/formation protein HypC
MCLAIPYKVLEVKENRLAVIEVAGTKQEISLELLPEIKAGDWILVNLGTAITRIDEAEATEIMNIYREILEAEAIPDRPLAGVVSK